MKRANVPIPCGQRQSQFHDNLPKRAQAAKTVTAADAISGRYDLVRAWTQDAANESQDFENFRKPVKADIAVHR
jgi:hypothetical protein